MSLVRSTLASACSLALVLFVFSISAFAQSDLTAISGFVRDATGAVIPNASVTLKNEATGQERKVTTNESGYYIFTNIPSSIYSVSAESKGFKTTSRTGAKVDPNLP